MASRGILVILVIPAAASLIFGGAVMYGLAYQGVAPAQPAETEGPRAELVGLQAEYSAGDVVEIRVMVLDPGFECGDLYVTIHPPAGSSRQEMFKSCSDGGLIPAEPFVEAVDVPGEYMLEATIANSDVKTISISKTFTVR